jgi:hypothetical protein
MRRHYLCALACLAAALTASADKVEPIKYGTFENWVTRNIKESSVIGGNTKQVYEIAPNATINGSTAYKNQGGSPWATSNVMAKVCGITKTSNAVFPDTRETGGRCCKMTTMMEHCKAIGIINIDVVVAGSIFLGEMLEPISSTKEPYSKMEMGVAFTKRPKAMQFDYKVSMPSASTGRTYSSGFGKKKQLAGNDNAEVYIILQRRWEDSEGNLYAKRVGTGRERYSKSTNGWVNSHKMTIHYGDITKESYYKSFMGLIPTEKSYYAKNSKGKMVPVKEVGWDDANATPTHMLIMASSGSGTAYIGTLGLTLWVDNFALVY